jgi:hypothetical protein
MQGTINISDVGPTGAQGTIGAQGFQGIQGSQGTQGFQGIQGSQGTQGFQGIQGSQGTQGSQGVGVQGSQGFQGIQGATGGGGGGTANIAIYDESTLVTSNVSGIRFIGTPVSAVLNGSNVDVTISATGGGGTANIAIYDESTLVTSNVSGINFVGSGVVATLDGSNVVVTISAAGGGGGSTSNASNVIHIIDTFNGDGSTTNFNLSSNASSTDSLVIVDGLVQYFNLDYSINNGTQLTFTNAPELGEIIKVLHLQGGASDEAEDWGLVDTSPTSTEDYGSIV